MDTAAPLSEATQRGLRALRAGARVVSFDGCLRTDASAIAVAEALEEDPNLQVLSIRYNQLGAEGIQALVKSAAAVKTLEALYTMNTIQDARVLIKLQEDWERMGRGHSAANQLQTFYRCSQTQK